MAADYVEGQHYTVLSNPVAITNPQKIEVVELFSYHCHYCFEFEPLLKTWKAKQAEDVVFTQMPAFWSEQTEPWVRGFYTAQILGIIDQTHMPAFNMFQIEKKQLNRAIEWANLYAKYDVTVEETVKTYNSWDVTKLASQTQMQMRNNYGASSTPELYVQGKYKIESNKDVPTQEQMLQVADFLIAKERKQLQNSIEQSKK